MRSTILILLGLSAIAFSQGCTRTRYRMAADRDTYQIIREKSACLGKHVPSNYSVTPDQRSRFYDPTNPDCPALPIPRPILYGYAIPTLASDAGRVPMQRSGTAGTLSTSPGSYPTPPAPAAETLAPPPPEVTPPTIPLPPVNENDEGEAWSRPLPKNLPAVIPTEPPVLPASFLAEPTLMLVEEGQAAEDASRKSVEEEGEKLAIGPVRPFANATVSKVTIPPEAWEVLPTNCLERMFVFDTLREEYERTFPQAQLESTREVVRQLTLANLMELAVINSREYQTRKEVLYRTALIVTRQRYLFDLNPTPSDNGTEANYRHSRDNGETINRLVVPSTVGVEKTLATGGEFLARFANSVVLTFNGPSGFAADVGSELIFDFQQTVFQRDVRFEALTQAERDVIYATRDYLRFRKQLFRDIANQYYNLLLNYRNIEINAQDYFTNLRGFIQSQAEYRTAEKIPRIQVDQFEQNVLRARSNLVNNCFALEAALDQLKFRLGLPTEMVIHLDLTELQSISLRDELSVARQMITRTRAELLNARSTTAMDATTLANVAEVLADRMANILRIQKRFDESEAEAWSADPANAATARDSARALDEATAELESLLQLLQILGVRMQVDVLRSELDLQLKAETPAPPLRILIRAIDFAMAEMQVIDLALDSKSFESQPQRRSLLLNRQAVLNKKLSSLLEFLERISNSVSLDTANRAVEDFASIPDRMKESIELVDELEALARDATFEILPNDGRSVESKVQETVDKTIALSDRLLAKGPDGWKEIEIDGDEALLTGLVQRLDLMNQRGDLADAWRQIKLAGDDLRSIVDLRATQVLGTRSTDDDPFDFTFDDSETRLSVALDTPLNRRLQRNNFRLALISYNQGLRNLMTAEDAIKLDIREDLRQLALDRTQYTIAVASAALAYERVISTRLRLQFAVQNVAARDFLESQQAYTNSLNAIARQHVNYITDRIELFFDLEAFDVDELGYWSGVTEDYGPVVNPDFPSTNPQPYDCLPQRVWYSPTIRRMEQIPAGDAIIYPAQ